MDADVYASNQTNQMWYKKFGDDFCDFVDEAFKTSRIALRGDTYAALYAGSESEPETRVLSGDDIDATINIDIDIRLNYPQTDGGEALAC